MGQTAKGKDQAEQGDTLRVMVVDDHALFRRGLEMVLEQEPDIELVGEAADGDEAIQRAAGAHARRRADGRPDAQAVRHRSRPADQGPPSHTCKILMLTISDEEADLYDAIKAGATGYLLKEIPIEEVADAIRASGSGQSRISPSMASKLLDRVRRDLEGDERAPADAGAAAHRSRDGGAASSSRKGLNNRDIAKELFISENTVKNHIRNILEKLHLHSRMEAVVYAVREKLLEIT